MNIQSFDSIKNIHLVGIGGISMSSIAAVLNDTGHNVTGSDRTRSELTDALAAHGVKIYVGHSASNISDDTQLIIYTAAIPADNPELIYAQSRGIPCMVRAEALGILMKRYRTPIGISGTHGKSTTTSMISEIFCAAQKNPTILSGAELSSIGGAYRRGGKEYFIFEACEYTDSFLHFFPKIAVVLNVDLDHVDYFHDIAQVRASFSKFIGITGKDGYAVINADSENAMIAARGYEGHTVTYSLKNTDSDYSARRITYENGRPSFDVMKKGAFTIRVSLSVIGDHNVSNALAAFAVSDICGVSYGEIADGLNAFRGAKRRFEYRRTVNGADIYEDYAHHPAEIRATLTAAKKIGYKRMICIFQPHTYTRASRFAADFANALSPADKVIFTDIYAARDKNVYNISSADLTSLSPGSIYIPTFEGIADYIGKEATDGDLFILMGAGDINKVEDFLG